ncbi:MAG TPA: signal recognition particle-docking protein FtsY [Tepidisphaeraceae bacterium]|jgi:fused signal recognition particle receptor|nr:signal recognition particle-docking protein FtsY [Tepidisphaeraceae bacterium]
MGFFSKTIDKLKGALRKTAAVLNTDVRTLFVPGRQINDEFLQEVEEKLLLGDFGVQNTMRIVDEIRDKWRLGKIRNAGEAETIVREQLLTGWGDPTLRELKFAPAGTPTVIMVCGVNGAGKTTSISKLTWLLTQQMHKKVMLCASDTFRAAAVEQLSIWAGRLGVEIVKHKMGADPAAVAYDACEAAKSRGMDVLIVDTAGRLHTQDNLMRELAKIRDVIAKRIPGAPHEVIQVMDATAGQNAIRQAEMFHKAVTLTGLFVAKLDGTAKGGFVFSIRDQLKVPVKFIGLGETPQDIETFDPARFINALFGDPGAAES